MKSILMAAAAMIAFPAIAQEQPAAPAGQTMGGDQMAPAPTPAEPVPAEPAMQAPPAPPAG